MAWEQKDLSRMLETATVAARLAGQRAMEEISYVKVSVKGSGELVTETDRRCQQIIIDHIKEAYPDHGFIAEEDDQARFFKQPPRGRDGVWWAIDPIDGTNNFARGIPLFGVSVAALHLGQPLVGVIFIPATESMFTAVRAGLAQQDGRHITCGDDDLNEFTSVALDSHFGDQVPTWVSKIMVRTRYRNFGTTALHLAYVARGGLVGAVVCTPKLWDIAAGAVISEAAGAVVTDWQGKNIFPIDLETYNGEPFQTVIANPKAHRQIVELIAAG